PCIAEVRFTHVEFVGLLWAGQVEYDVDGVIFVLGSAAVAQFAPQPEGVFTAAVEHFTVRFGLRLHVSKRCGPSPATGMNSATVSQVRSGSPGNAIVLVSTKSRKANCSTNRGDSQRKNAGGAPLIAERLA